MLDEVENDLDALTRPAGLNPEEIIERLRRDVTRWRNHLRVCLYAATLEMDPEWRDEMAALGDKLEAGWKPEGQPVDEFVRSLRDAS